MSRRSSRAQPFRRALRAVALLGLLSAGGAAATQVPAPPPGEPAPEVPVLPHAEGEGPLVTLPEAIDAALRVSPDLAEAQGNLSVAKAGRKRSVGAYLPNLNLRAGSSVSSSERFDPVTSVPLTGASGSLNTGLALSWDVFTGLRRSSEFRRTRAQVEAAEGVLTDRSRTVVFDVTASYHEALSAARLAEVAKSRLSRAGVQLAAAQRRSQLGTATRSDVLRAQLEVHTARTQVVEAQAQQRAAQRDLGRLTGRGEAVRPSPLPEVSLAAPALSPAELDQLVEAHPQVAAARASLEAAHAGIGVARAPYLPALRLSGAYDWYSPVPVQTARNSWSLSLGLSYPLFDGFARDESFERARAGAATQRSALEDLRRAVRAQLRRALDDERVAAWRVESSRAAVAAAQEDLRVQQERYNVGASTMLDLLSSQERLVTAETDAIAASLLHATARAELTALTGRPL